MSAQQRDGVANRRPLRCRAPGSAVRSVGAAASSTLNIAHPDVGRHLVSEPRSRCGARLAIAARADRRSGRRVGWRRPVRRGGAVGAVRRAMAGVAGVRHHDPDRMRLRRHAERQAEQPKPAQDTQQLHCVVPTSTGFQPGTVAAMGRSCRCTRHSSAKKSSRPLTIGWRFA
jgi:hypothetical protein